MKTIFILFYCLIFSAINAQKNVEKLYFLDSSYNYVKTIDNAMVFLIKQKLENDKIRFTYYNAKSFKAIRLEHFEDEEGEVANGLFGYYNIVNGQLDSIGEVVNSKRTGSWHFYDAFGKNPDTIVEVKEYENGKLLSTDISSVNKDNYEEPKFDGSLKRFLEKNLTYPKAAQDNMWQGIVKVYFIVDEYGKILDNYLSKSANYFLDVEARRIIALSDGKWIPAKKDGKNIKSYHMQPISFVIASY
jgi:hypothetical protein